MSQDKKKFWIALGEHLSFTKDDKRIAYVFFSGSRDNAGHPLQDKFIEADTIDEARFKLKSFVDELCDHQAHMQQLELMPTKEERIAKAKEMKFRPDTEVDSLVIGDVVGKKEEPVAMPKPQHDDLLDLKDLL